MRSTFLWVTLAAALGCSNQTSSKLESFAPSAPKTVEGGTTTTAAEPTAAAPKGDVEARLARVERRLDKVIAILEQALPPNEPDPEVNYSVPIGDLDPQEGPKDAKVTIVEGYEFLCPYCYMANPTVEQIKQKYPKDVRIVAKYLIIHGQPAVEPGMMACAAAKQGKYSELKAALWDHIFKMENGMPKRQDDQIKPEALEKIAKDVGIDVAKMKADEDGCQAWLRSSQEALKPVGVNATPAFFVNGRYVSGAQPFEVFDKLIQEELAKADKAIADGVKPADYYAKLVETGAKQVKGRFED